MQRFRTLFLFVRILVALFVLAQFAGVVSSPFTAAHASVITSAAHLHHLHAHQDTSSKTPDEHEHGLGHADYCCALHAFFVGVLPLAIAIEVANGVGKQVFTGLDDVHRGVAPGRLDRPPRSFV